MAVPRRLLASVPYLLGRLRRGEGSGGPHSVVRADHRAVVACAVYEAGRRLPAGEQFVEAYRLARRRRKAFVWLGLHDPDPDLLVTVGRTFGLHQLTVEQAGSDGHRPTIEVHGDVTLLVLRTASYVEHGELTDSSEVVDTGDVMVLLGEQFVVTIRHGASGTLSAVRAKLQQQPALLAEGPWAVAHAVVGRMIDLYADVAGHVEKDLERVEESVFARDRATDIEHIYQLKRELTEFKRAVMPLQTPLRSLLDEHRRQVPAALHRYFTEADTRLNRIVDRVASLDDLLNSVLQARLAQVTIAQNNDMRKIASWAAIAAVQTAIAGIYGMNFEVMPELKWQLGYAWALGLMAAAGFVLYRWFRRSGWL